jgi:hypothetical protein
LWVKNPNILVDVEMNDLSNLSVGKVLNSDLCSHWCTDHLRGTIIVDVEMNDLSNLPVGKVLNSNLCSHWCNDHLRGTIIVG